MLEISKSQNTLPVIVLYQLILSMKFTQKPTCCCIEGLGEMTTSLLVVGVIDEIGALGVPTIPESL